MSTKSPSKYLSLAFLKAAQANYSKSEGGIEYDAEELAQLISQKEEKAFDAYSEDWWTMVDQSSSEFDGWEDFSEVEQVLELSAEDMALVFELGRKVIFKGVAVMADTVKRAKTGGRKRKVLGGWSSIILPTKLVEHIKARGHPVSPWVTDLIIKEFKRLAIEGE